MNPSQIQSKKLNLNKQTIQKLNINKLAGLFAAGNANNGFPTIVTGTVDLSNNTSPTIINSFCAPDTMTV